MKTGLRTLAATFIAAFIATSSPAAAENCLDAIRQSGSLRSANGLLGLKPWVWKNEDGSYAGFEAELFAELAKRLGVKAEYVVTEWTTLIPGLQANRWDILLTGLAVTQERMQSAGIAFSDPYFLLYDVAMVTGGSPLKTLDDLKDKIVGSTMGSTDSLTAHWLVETGRAKEVMDYNGYTEPFIALRNGQVDAVIMDQATLIGQRDVIPDLRALEGEPMPYRPKPEWQQAEAAAPYKMGAIGVGLRPECEDLRVAVNKALADMNADGSRRAILEKYGIWADLQINLMK